MLPNRWRSGSSRAVIRLATKSQQLASINATPDPLFFVSLNGSSSTPV